MSVSSRCMAPMKPTPFAILVKGCVACVIGGQVDTWPFFGPDFGSLGSGSAARHPHLCAFCSQRVGVLAWLLRRA